MGSFRIVIRCVRHVTSTRRRQLRSRQLPIDTLVTTMTTRRHDTILSVMPGDTANLKGFYRGHFGKLI